MKRRRNESRNVPDGFFALKPGTKVRVKHCIGAYRLPTGLEPGDEVTILGFDHGYYDVARDGSRFKISVTCVDSEDGVGNARR
jgi:hypothetical protein